MAPAGSLTREIRAVRRSLSALDKALSRLAAHAGRTVRTAVTAPGRTRRKINLSPARRRALKLHGQYMGYVRQLKPRAKAKVRDLRMKKGLRAAIARARKLATA
jgi:hypothetical protein